MIISTLVFLASTTVLLTSGAILDMELDKKEIAKKDVASDIKEDVPATEKVDEGLTKGYVNDVKGLFNSVSKKEKLHLFLVFVSSALMIVSFIFMVPTPVPVVY